MLLLDKVAIVTGAGRGIGLATAKALAGEGVRVLVADITETAAEAAAEELKKGGGLHAKGVVCGISKESDVIATVDVALKHFGSLDIFCSLGLCRVIEAGMDGPSAKKVLAPHLFFGKLTSS